MNQSDLNNILSSEGSALFYTPPQGKKGTSLIFKDPKEILSASDAASVKRILNKTERLIHSGLSGFILADYEAGYLFEKKLHRYIVPVKDHPVKIFLYKKDNITEIPSGELHFFSSGQKEYSLSGFHFNTSKKEYTANIEKIKNLIREGDTYQVNYTVRGKFRFKGNPFGLFKVLLFNQSALYSAFINTGGRYILSLSPELFFSVAGDEIVTRPMKGTLKRTDLYSNGGDNPEFLKQSEKERSENLMIVDLLRNDLGRISHYGSVKTEKLFQVEKYETLYQMVSTIRGKLNRQTDLYDIFRNIFPCGSVTGAPKIRTMEIISELEKEPRGIYTGSIGLLFSDKKIFNVAIRTLTIDKKTGAGEIGLGSGIVWDSKPGNEYKEVILKSRFLTKPDQPFRLIETMLLKDGIFLFKEEHLGRLEKSSRFFLFNFDRHKITLHLNKILKYYPRGEFKVRLLLSKEGSVESEVLPPAKQEGEMKIIISEKRNHSADKFLYHKTTSRKVYDREYHKYIKQGFFDVVFLNENEEICEGAISNIFLRKGNVWYTPEITCGLLPGIYRKFLLDNLEKVSETKLYLNDLIAADEIVLVNSVRGRISVDKIYHKDKIIFRKMPAHHWRG